MAKSWDLKETITVTKVQRVENPIAYIEYQNKLKRLISHGLVDTMKPPTGINEKDVHTATLNLDLDKHCVREVNEYLFFHGTSPSVVSAVVGQGMDQRLANNGYFGKGIYLAEMAAKSHQYTGRCNQLAPQKLQLCRIQ